MKYNYFSMPKKLSGQQLREFEEATRRAEIEHAPGVGVRLNKRTWKLEYYKTDTGEIISSHY